MADLTQLRKSYDSAKDDSRRQVDHLKDKTVAKVFGSICYYIVTTMDAAACHSLRCIWSNCFMIQRMHYISLYVVKNLFHFGINHLSFLVNAV